MHACTDHYILIRKSFSGNGVRNHVNSEGKETLYWRFRGEKNKQTNKKKKTLLLEGRTCDGALRKTMNPTHYRLSYSGPSLQTKGEKGR